MENVKLVSAAVVLFLLLLILLLRLLLGNSKSFFLISSIEASVFFSTFITIILKLITYGVDSTISVIKLIILTIALSVVIIAIAITSCIRLGYSTTFYIIGGVDILLLLVLCSCLCCRRDRRRGPSNERHVVQSLSSVTQRELIPLEYSHLRYVAGLPKNFSYEELAAATNNFQNRIGRGGSGSVFKGVLTDGSALAVKRIEGEVRGEREFWNELVTIASVQHFNLVRLIGCCLVPGDHLHFLVYEFIENSSLDSWIFKKNNGGGGGGGGEEACLTWALRYQVAVDIAKALAYLHHDCRSKILHLDVKPENILLDADFRGHLSDFGISRLMKRDETSVLTTVRGTRGYLAPEWFFGDGISEKSDVYSYGMVLLELVGGQRNMRVIQGAGDDNVNHSTTMKCHCFPRIASEKLREGKVMEVVDERLLKMRSGTVGVEDQEKEVKALVCVALWCIQEKPELRPSMELVVDMLEGHVDVSMPPVTRMFMGGFLLPLVAVESSIREEDQELSTVDSSMHESSIDLH